MTKKIIADRENPNGIEVEMTAEEIAQKEIDDAQGTIDDQNGQEAFERQKDLKASAKAKLIAGEALTEDEANTIVL
tara:strand:+ start:2273 stop:2500 length:228 start_codon:yes stop_codon:yes gene_type:complete